MPTFTYTASRSIKSGHSAGTDYVITIGLQQYDGQTPKPDTTVHRSLSGYTVTTLRRIDYEITVQTDFISADGSGTPDTDDFEEFLASVAGGEQFTFNDGAAYNVILVGASTRRREGSLLFSYSIKMRLE
ncbi:MAG: hypothetical protein ACR2Q3_01625 [Woeseiaceae bacterium]